LSLFIHVKDKFNIENSDISNFHRLNVIVGKLICGVS